MGKYRFYLSNGFYGIFNMNVKSVFAAKNYEF